MFHNPGVLTSSAKPKWAVDNDADDPTRMRNDFLLRREERKFCEGKRDMDEISYREEHAGPGDLLLGTEAGWFTLHHRVADDEYDQRLTHTNYQV
ncbi:hypothetical protein NPX13_g7425 [Xylaria arbuscula]|uniref:Uncharacterized protein n=1 Tax=Xylaria arbuscula TaxID=114810 RepID=A0A9W8NAQ1_9PEZI|nr:hypothetical protein NPX13_g7425 [Xylaria arbuscula]